MTREAEGEKRKQENYRPPALSQEASCEEMKTKPNLDTQTRARNKHRHTQEVI